MFNGVWKKVNVGLDEFSKIQMMALERNSNSEPKITYALNPEGELVHIDTVANGYSCNCTCAGCGEKLNARNNGDKNQHHFAHKENTGKNCYEVTLHLRSKDIIKNNKKVCSPAYDGGYYKHQSEILNFVEVEVEERNDYSDMQPDLVGVTEEGKRIFIEIRYSHKVDEKKKEKLRKRTEICMEIDVSKQRLEDLEKFLLSTSEKREWINHPEFDKKNKEAKERYEQNISEEERRVRMMLSLSEEDGYNPAYPKYKTLENTIEEEPKPVIINDAEQPTIVPNKALDPIIEKLRKERIVKDGNGNTYHVDLCEQTYDGKYIVARVFDENYKTSHQAAHIVLINSFGTISYDFGNESGENLYSWRYTYARRRY